MTPANLKAARHTLGLSLTQMARLLGYTGTHGAQQVRKMESGNRAIREAQALLVQAYLDGYRPDAWPKKENTDD
jgi:transcriptional regulator with XRE-family HTH domain